MGSSITIGLAVEGNADGTLVREESTWPSVIVVTESFVLGEAVASTNSETGLSDPGTKNTGASVVGALGSKERVGDGPIVSAIIIFCVGTTVGASVVGALGSKEGFVVGFPVSSGMTNLLVGAKVGLTVGSVVRGKRNPPKFDLVGL